MQNRRKSGGRRPFKYWLVLLIAAAIAETVHAPAIHKAQGSVAPASASAPNKSNASKPSGKDSNSPGPVVAGAPRSGNDEQPKEQAAKPKIDASSLPSDSPEAINLLPDAAPVPNDPVADDSSSPFLPVAGSKSDGFDPLLALPPETGQLPPYDLFGGFGSGGGFDVGALINPNLHLSTSTEITAVPEPRCVVVVLLGGILLLRRRPRSIFVDWSESV